MPALKTLIFIILVPGSVTVLVPYWMITSQTEPSLLYFGLFRYVGILIIAIGVMIYLWCAWDFAFTGRGTPAPIDPPQILVAKGMYRYIRNPMYVGVFSQLLGEAIFFESLTVLIYSLILLTGFHLFVVFYEERVLLRKFGESYSEYLRTVPRWLPRMKF